MLKVLALTLASALLGISHGVSQETLVEFAQSLGSNNAETIQQLLAQDSELLNAILEDGQTVRLLSCVCVRLHLHARPRAALSCVCPTRLVAHV